MIKLFNFILLGKEEYNNLIESNISKSKQIINQLDRINNLQDEINLLKYTSDKEKYYDTKYPKQNISYRRTDSGKTINIDVRQFLNPNNFNLPKISGNNDDEIMINSLSWVVFNIKYVPDKTQYGMDEYWAFPYQVLDTKKDDCEGGSVLLYCIARANGIPAWKLRVNCGWVVNPYNGNTEGHAYLTYYSESEDKWFSMDWCFLPNANQLKDRDSYKDEAHYGDVWFSFNENSAWGRDVDLRKSEVKEVLNK
jgi:transglutaminase-like putative cysteine protease